MVRVPPKIKDLDHRIAICKNDDVVVDGSMELRREAVRWTWAVVEHQTYMSSFISKSGFATQEQPSRPTHRITVRRQHDIDYTAAAWVYEEFRKSPPRWYKVIGFVDECNWVMLDCHLVQRNENVEPVAPQPEAPTVMQPTKQGVVL